jgi:GDPmannose 4,6-dehydratase
VKKALIIGCKGQDGILLTDLLIDNGYEVIGLEPHSVFVNREMSSYYPSTNVEYFDDVSRLVKLIKPNEVYYLAAYHQSAEEIITDEKTLYERSHAINVKGMHNFLEAIRISSPLTKIFYPASSHIFGNTSEFELQDENTPIDPSCIYGITKATGFFISRYYRKHYSIFATTGILYNHESKYRPENFLSRRIIKGVAQIKRGEKKELVLGNIDSKVDWGFAADYVRAIYAIMQLDEPDEFIIASGETHSVREFVDIAFSFVGLDWQDYVVIDKSILKKPEIYRVGNPKKIMEYTGWRPQYTFSEMIKILLTEEGVIFELP